MQLNVEKKILLTAIFVSMMVSLIFVFYAVFGLRQNFDNQQILELALVALAVFTVTTGSAYVLSNDLRNDPKNELGTISEGTKALSNIESNSSNERRDLPNNSTALNTQEQDQKQWMADTSHELRTPIAILRAQVEAFQDGVQEVTPKTLQVLHTEIMGLSKLVDDLHWLSRFDVGSLKHSFVPVDVVSTLHDVSDLFEERYAEKELTIDKSGITSESCTVYADNNRMRQVFINLLENSLRYTDKGGKLKFSIEKSPTAIVLRFDDSHPGIPEELLPKVFDRFFRVESSRSRELGGSGLGLAICKTIIEAHSGSINASKSDLGGIRIEIILPTARGLRGG